MNRDGPKRRVLVAGAGGFIGGHVACAFHRGSWVVYGLSRRGASLTDVDVSASDELACGNEDRIGRWIAEVNPDVIVNCTGTLTADPEVAVHANVHVTEELVRLCARHAPKALLIQLGSSAEYGPAGVGKSTREDDLADPKGAYGRAKLAATTAVLRAHRRGRLRATVLRVFNVLGADMPCSTLPGRLASFLRDKAADRLVVGSLSAYRDFVDVRDVAIAVVRVSQHATLAKGHIINVGSGHAREVRELAECMIARTGRRVQITETGTGSDRSQGVPWQEADVSKAAHLIGWCLSVTWDATVDYILERKAAPRRTLEDTARPEQRS